MFSRIVRCGRTVPSLASRLPVDSTKKSMYCRKIWKRNLPQSQVFSSASMAFSSSSKGKRKRDAQILNNTSWSNPQPSTCLKNTSDMKEPEYQIVPGQFDSRKAIALQDISPLQRTRILNWLLSQGQTSHLLAPRCSRPTYCSRGPFSPVTQAIQAHERVPIMLMYMMRSNPKSCCSTSPNTV